MMGAVAHFDERVLFGRSILPATNSRLQYAVAARHRDNSEAENVLWEARAEDPTCLPVYFALYKFYANSKKLDRAERAARLAIAESARQVGISANWERVAHNTLGLHDTEAGLFYLYSLKALSFIKLRRGHLQEASDILQHLARLDPNDLSGGSVVMGLAESVSVGADDAVA
jgi:tetratricopeptide (TPR) repeat protein